MTAIKRVTKAVFPVAGLGTRFLPATKANPKEMLPVVDKPLIQYAVEEAVAAGITELVFITGRSKRAIPDHFDTAYELEATLEKGGKNDMLELVRNITPPNVTCIYIRQAAPLGLGHAVLCAAPVVGDAPFAVLLADDLIAARDPGLHTATCLKDMIDVYNQRGASIIGVEEIPIEFSRRYGIVKPRAVGNGLYEVDDIVEKPAPENAPSNLGVVGRYVLTPRVFDLLRATQRGAGGEIQLTDALAELIKFERLFAYNIPGHRYDCGSKLGYLEATIEYGLRHPELGEDFKQFLLERANESFEPRS
ncbi:UTP--glucose-1-phosphate uridylyltransferase GalU [Immundisolibacter sp.]|jgi:UTP--glucose-1-phosphate uridylyltransferase|uniref:UTP--glucose-1-phosphate uridylyltransferase GalU n=1 Tax=Immundisolibacter sp. TaxID=1934948 RepID=UPI0019B8CC73|nr:UTP--glucose-1-phosphate uridylyltransferase GalU [Immundisolibacter sp.]MBC7163104.1 UTP--glucose-1-phosphate uridylyltransferase GalU [Immundisolibacter sp.]MEA3220564.1 UTP--glucose-1-phosphate uridylyltransferase [Immundisolibacter sp.]